MSRSSLPQATELSIPVEFNAEGKSQVIARLCFDAPLKKEYLTRIRAFLEAWEKTEPPSRSDLNNAKNKTEGLPAGPH
jgi:hypothetical protein